MEKLKEITRIVTGKQGGSYSHSLLGEGLADLLRKATAKTLVSPDEDVNQLVVDTIQQDVASGRDTKEIVSLLKKRLRTDNPQKQWLGVLLFAKVLQDCSNVLGMHQEELLQEVARVMARPAKPESEPGKAARQAAKELLRRFGRAGTTAFRAAHQEVYGRPVAASAMAGGMAPGYPVGGYTAGPQQAVLASVERQSLVEEVTLLIDKARSNTELLSDMLVNQGAPGSDEFERELVNDLLNEVLELRGLFSAYLEQLQAQEGPEMEVLLVQALEAADMLDGCLALQSDVTSNQQMPAEGASPPAGQRAGGSSSGAAGSAGGSGSKAPPPRNDDLIMLDDLAEGLMHQTALSAPAGVYDPFAASAAAPLGAAISSGPSAGSGMGSGGLGAAGGSAGVGKSAFETMFAGGPAAAAGTTAPGVSSYGGGPPGQPPPPYGPHHGPAGGNPGQGYMQGYPGAPAQYGMYPAAPPGAGGPFSGGTSPSGYGPPAAGAPAGNPFAVGVGGLPAPAAQSQGAQFGLPMPPAGLMGPAFQQMQPTGHNPFAAAPGLRSSTGGGAPVAAATNPFGSPPQTAAAPSGPAATSTGPASSVQQEWEMFFSDRAAAAQPQPAGVTAAAGPR